MKSHRCMRSLMTKSNSAVAIPQRISRELRRLLEEEIRLQREYVDLLQAETDAMVKFGPEQIYQTVAQREILTGAMRAIAEQRVALLESAGIAPGQKLSRIVSERCTGEDKRILTALVEQVRGGLATVQGELRKHASVTRFCQGLVSGTLSILFSGSQSVHRSYSRRGEVRERALPAQKVSKSTLGEA